MTSKSDLLRQVAENRDIKEFLSTVRNSSEVKSHSKYNKVLSVMRNLSNVNSDIGTVWIASDSKKFLLSGHNYLSPGFAPQNCPWYSPIVSNSSENYVWYSPSVHLGIEGNDVISIVLPIKENGNILGYAGLEIFSERFNSILEDSSLAKGVYPVILTADGTMIYSSDKEEFTQKFNLNSLTISELVMKARYSDEGTEQFFSNGNTNYLKFQRSPLTHWKILIFLDSEIALSNPHVFFLQEIILLICFSLLLIIITSAQIRTSVSDIPPMIKQINGIRSGNYTTKLNCKRTDEWGQMANAIDSLTKELQGKLNIQEKLLNYDNLTDLPNRQRVYNEIKEYICTANTNGTKFAVVFMDISNFKWINDTLGHNYGDEYLKIFATKLKEIVEPVGFIGRFGGDIFTLLIPFKEDVEEVNSLINRIKNEFQSSITVYHDELYVKFSTGIAIFPDDDYSPDLLLRDADVAINSSKEHGLGRPEYYNNSKHKQISNKAKIGQKLTNALASGELQLSYQPIIETVSKKIHGFEVLLRWDNSELGSISPEEFIPIAEETGSILSIGTWTLESACRFHKKICEEFHTDFVISINVSPQQIIQAGFVENVKRVLDITNIKPELIQLEITETVLINLFDTANSVFRQLCDLGISIALDDFGTGYSSLNYLKHFPIKCLKIDKSFVDEIFNNKKDYSITDSIISLVRNLDIKTVAEGVETEGQYNSLMSMHCDLIQGYIVSKPLNEQKTVEFIQNYNELHRL